MHNFLGKEYTQNPNWDIFSRVRKFKQNNFIKEAEKCNKDLSCTKAPGPNSHGDFQTLLNIYIFLN